MKLVRLFFIFTTILLSVSLRNATAVNILYNFEGDSGTTITDKLSSDGAQNGVTYNNVSIMPTSSGVSPGFGANAVLLDNPPDIVTGDYSTVEIPDSTFGLSSSFTLSGWVYQDITTTPLRRFRVFSSYSGTGGVPNNVLMLDAGNELTRSSIRGIVGGIQFSGTTMPPLSSGYHHYAMTVDGSITGNSAVKLYINGAPITTSTTGTLGLYSNAVNLRIGEDINPFPQQNSANEQIVGNVDDMLVLGRSLSAGDIASIYNGGLGASVSSLITPLPSEKAIYYDFEGDLGTTITDKFTLDGGQNGIAREDAMVDGSAANAKLGSSSFHFADPQPPITLGEEIYSQINAGPVGNLGANFTLSAVVNPYSTGQFQNGVARIFSSYQGTASTAGQLLLDFNPSTATGLRLFLPSNTGAATLSIPGPGLPDLDLTSKQTITVVYETGATNDSVKVYLEGALIGSKLDLLPGTVQNLGTNSLRIGEDVGGYRGAWANENYIGSMDDIMILSRALTPEQVQLLASQGADALIATLPPDGTPGDFDGDGDVDGRDFLAWQRGSSPEPFSAGDLAEWQDNYNAGMLSANIAIPEPSAALLVLIGLAVAPRGRTRARGSR